MYSSVAEGSEKQVDSSLVLQALNVQDLSTLNNDGPFECVVVDKAPYGVDLRIRVHSLQTNEVPWFCSRFSLLWIILPHCKLFLWAETIVKPTLDSSTTSVVEEVDSLAADGHHRYSSVAEGS